MVRTHLEDLVERDVVHTVWRREGGGHVVRTHLEDLVERYVVHTVWRRSCGEDTPGGPG